MKRSIIWHKECLRNMENHYIGLSEQAERLIDKRDRVLRENAIYRAQIKRAIAEGRDGFYADKFNKPRKAK